MSRLAYIITVLFGVICLSSIGQVSHTFRPDSLQMDSLQTPVEVAHRYEFQITGLQNYRNLGNVGLPAYSTKWLSQNEVGFDMGMSSLAVYLKKQETSKVFHTPYPYTDLGMVIGLDQELLFSGTHAQDLSPRVKIGVDFDRITADGQYSLQKTKMNAFSLYQVLRSSNDRFALYNNTVFNRLQANQNGGLSEDLFNRDSSLITSLIASVNLADASFDYRDISNRTELSYSFGSAYEKRIDDTTSSLHFRKRLVVGGAFEIGREKYTYLDRQPDTLFYEHYYYHEDSLTTWYQFRSTKGEVFTEWIGGNGNSSYVPFFIRSSVGIENIELDHFNTERTYNTGFATLDMYSKSNNGKLELNAEAYWAFAGYGKNEISLQGDVAYNIDNQHVVYAKFNKVASKPDWLKQHFKSPSISWDNHLAEEHELSTEIGAQSRSLGLRAFANYSIRHNLISFEDAVTIVQNELGIPMLQVGLAKDLALGKFHFNNEVVWQYTSNRRLLWAPEWLFNHQLYYKNNIFNGAALVALGLDVRWSLSQELPGFNPVLLEFLPEGERNANWLPVVDVFLNAQIQSVTLFGKLVHANNGLLSRGNYNALFYPERGLTFVAGISWRFKD